MGDYCMVGIQQQQKVVEVVHFHSVSRRAGSHSFSVTN
jgi:hypothetical protein